MDLHVLPDLLPILVHRFKWLLRVISETKPKVVTKLDDVAKNNVCLRDYRSARLLVQHLELLDAFAPPVHELFAKTSSHNPVERCECVDVQKCIAYASRCVVGCRCVARRTHILLRQQRTQTVDVSQQFPYVVAFERAVPFFSFDGAFLLYFFNINKTQLLVHVRREKVPNEQ